VNNNIVYNIILSFKVIVRAATIISLLHNNKMLILEVISLNANTVINEGDILVPHKIKSNTVLNCEIVCYGQPVRTENSFKV
jgi:hypothetical protein